MDAKPRQTILWEDRERAVLPREVIARAARVMAELLLPRLAIDETCDEHLEMQSKGEGDGLGS
jgi:hypothetical protein